MKPVAGWSAFVATGTYPFNFVVEALDEHDRVVATTPVRRAV